MIIFLWKQFGKYKKIFSKEGKKNHIPTYHQQRHMFDFCPPFLLKTD